MLQKTKNPTPCLTGLRGIQIKHLVPVVAEVLRSKYNPTNPQHRDMLEGLAASEQVDKIIGRNMMNYRPSEADAVLLVDSAYEFNRRNAALIQYFRSVKKNLFNFTIKFHYLLELALVGEYTNPSYGSCYQGEEMMAVVRKLISSCATSARPEVAANNAMQKYIGGLSMLLDLKNR